MAGQNRKTTPRNLNAWQAMLHVVARLRQNGYQAILAGGCVRDRLMRITPKDYDVATNAVPAAIAKIFPRTLMVGAKFGVAVVLVGKQQIEVATFRSDQSYSDGRRPDSVVFTDAKHDAQRRDFTINGLFYDPIEKKIIDYVDGRADLKARLIRAIGNPDARFEEDHLRMLRAVRFACRLGFTIEERTWLAIVKNSAKIADISAERITAELEIILTHPNRAAGMTLIRESGLLTVIFESLPMADLDFGIRVLGTLPKQCSLTLALAALFCKIPHNQVSHLCRNLKTSNDIRTAAHWLVAKRHDLIADIPMSIGRLKKWLAEPLFVPLVRLTRAFLLAANLNDSPLRLLRRQIRQLGSQAVSPARLLDGHDLIRLGAAHGPMIGRLAEELYMAQLENHIQTKSQAIDWVKNWLEKHRAEQ